MSMGVPYDKRIFPQKTSRGVENQDGATKNQKADTGETQEVLVRVENEQQNLSNEEAKSKQADHAVDDDQATPFLGAQVFLLSDLIDGSEQAFQKPLHAERCDWFESSSLRLAFFVRARDKPIA